MGRCRLKTALALACAAALAGCAAPAPKAPTVQDSEFDALRTIAGRDVRIEGDPKGAHTFRVRAFVDKKSGAVAWQLYASLHYTGDAWRLYQSASFEDATQAPLQRLSTDVSCTRYFCSYTEIVGVMLPSDRITKAPLRVRLNARQGIPVLVTIPAEYVAELAAIASPPKP